MKMSTYTIILVVLAVTSTSSTAQDGNFTPQSVTIVEVGSIIVTKESGMLNFPDEIDIDLVIDGVTVTQSRATRTNYVRPLQAIDSNGVKVDNTNDFFREAFYVDKTGSYIVKAVEHENGTITTEITGLFHLADQDVTCNLLADGRCVCANDTQNHQLGECVTIDPQEMNNGSSSKRKRQVGVSYTDFNPSVALRLVFVIDKSVVDSFRDLADTDQAAIGIAMNYFTALTNEINYMYQSIKEDTTSNTDITIFEAGVFYPAIGTDLSFLTPSITGNQLNVVGVGVGALSAFGTWVGAGNLNAFNPFDTATLFTRLDLARTSDGAVNTDTIGIAYLGTTCTDDNDKKVSIIEDLHANTAWTLAHELAHGLSVRHDSEGNPCTVNTNLMSPTQFDVTLFSRNTWNRFSACSIQYIMYHLTAEDCPLGVSEDDFYDNLCLGTRGELFDIDFQCQRKTTDSSSTACQPSSIATNGGKVPANACSFPELVTCSTSSGCTDNLFMVYDGIPCVGDTADDHVCHRGSCVRKADICATRPQALVSASVACVDPCPSTNGKLELLRCCSELSGSSSNCCGSCVGVGSNCRPRPVDQCVCPS